MSSRSITVILILLTATLVGAFQSSTHISKASFNKTNSNKFIEQGKRGLMVRGGEVSPALKSTLSPIATKSVLSAINVFYKRYPFVAGALTCAVKGSLADLVAQSGFGKKGKGGKGQSADPTVDQSRGIDWRRNLAFAIYSAVFVGLFAEYLYNSVHPIIFGHAITFKIVATKVLCDSLFVAPTVWIPPAYLMKAKMAGKALKDGWLHYVDDVRNRGVLFKYAAVWMPVMSITFSIIPIHFRVTFNAAVSFFWLIILSTLSAEADEEECVLTDAMTCDN